MKGGLRVSGSVLICLLVGDAKLATGFCPSSLTVPQGTHPLTSIRKVEQGGLLSSPCSATPLVSSLPSQKERGDGTRLHAGVSDLIDLPSLDGLSPADQLGRGQRINWYPGHVAKAERQLQEFIKLVDVVVELRDSRIPLSTSHPKVDEWVGERPKLVVFARSDQVPPAVPREWIRFYKGIAAAGLTESEAKELLLSCGREGTWGGATEGNWGGKEKGDEPRRRSSSSSSDDFDFFGASREDFSPEDFLGEPEGISAEAHAVGFEDYVKGLLVEEERRKETGEIGALDEFDRKEAEREAQRDQFRSLSKGERKWKMKNQKRQRDPAEEEGRGSEGTEEESRRPKGQQEKVQLTDTQKIFFVNAKKGTIDINKLREAIVRVGESVNAKRTLKGLKPRPVRALVIGYPNVGKSALINRLIGKAKAKSFDSPGVTRQISWVRLVERERKGPVHRQIEILDSPGVLPPNPDDQEAMWKLAFCNEISSAAFNTEFACEQMLEHIFRTNVARPAFCSLQMFRTRYDVEPFPDNSFRRDCALAARTVLDKLAVKRFVGNRHQAACRLLVDFRKGALGQLAFEPPPSAERLEKALLWREEEEEAARARVPDRRLVVHSSPSRVFERGNSNSRDGPMETGDSDSQALSSGCMYRSDDRLRAGQEVGIDPSMWGLGDFDGW
uniref:G domain-containing protein n=1 Tax=Chromera velia CCMP2878 TaxID=1169474 RepID=A0A0G4F733_9ALVE|eukprot:Cvel_15590.t1-p1 / transcript=Cvel_15590.t1 / gene=Cvel_15590 / organism=Chromera_velia_CCMP2878 / gene_product=Ribosome biogenesis GTPase A, putative / transcript_product=Ribosome biogenesis GTPase A, putative / location=Cvel_scaffold1159:37816-43341(+) / protein_length=670 / sequence_SO=supercontig / SO=protein_coding / is_pseudo=false